MTWEAFWIAFLPAVAAALVAVVVGIPVALWIDRVVRNLHYREIAQRDAVRLAQLSSSLSEAINRNITALQQIANLPAPSALYVSGLDVSLWDVWKGDVVQLLPDPVLRGDLAIFFNHLDVIERLNDQLLRLHTSAAAALMGSEKTREQVHLLLTRNAAEGITIGLNLRDRLNLAGATS
jgi:hypothetical protein